MAYRIDRTEIFERTFFGQKFLVGHFLVGEIRKKKWASGIRKNIFGRRDSGKYFQPAGGIRENNFGRRDFRSRSGEIFGVGLKWKIRSWRLKRILNHQKWSYPRGVNVRSKFGVFCYFFKQKRALIKVRRLRRKCWPLPTSYGPPWIGPWGNFEDRRS